MNLTTDTIESLAAHLDDCMREARDTPKITDRHPEMDWDDAYAVQDAIRRRQLARGARIVGYKAGLTSHAKMRQMGVDTPVFGFVADYMAREVETLDSDMELVQAAERFLASHFRRFPVLRDGRLAGQISRTDVLRGLTANWR